MSDPLEYRAADLVAAVRRHGPELRGRQFRPKGDLRFLVMDGVTGNTFRAFRKLDRPPSVIFREWAHSRAEEFILRVLPGAGNQAAYDGAVNEAVDDLCRHWEPLAGKQIPMGSAHKLLAMLFKSLARYDQLEEDQRERVVSHLHIPLDRFSLAVLRDAAESSVYGPVVEIPKDASMGFVRSRKRHYELQDVARAVADEAGVPVIDIDILAWNDPHDYIN